MPSGVVEGVRRTGRPGPLLGRRLAPRGWVLCQLQRVKLLAEAEAEVEGAGERRERLLTGVVVVAGEQLGKSRQPGAAEAAGERTEMMSIVGVEGAVGERRERLTWGGEEDEEGQQAIGKAVVGAGGTLKAVPERMKTGAGAPEHRVAGVDVTPESRASEMLEGAASSQSEEEVLLLTLSTPSKAAWVRH